MPRNKITYQGQVLYVGPTPATGQHFNSGNSGVNQIVQLHRVQSCNYDYNVARVDVNQFGELGAIDRVILDTPTVGLNVTYLLANFWNERNLGFNVDGTVTCISGILNKTADEKNYFLKVSDDGVDGVGDTDTSVATVGFGNGFISSYTSEASVGAFPMVSLNIEALNNTWDNSISGYNPAVNPADGQRITTWRYRVPTATSNAGGGDLDISVLRPGDITITFKQRNAADEGILANATGVYNTLGADINDIKIQSYRLAVALSRQPIQKLGNKFAFSREITLPINATLSIEAILGDITTGSLSDVVNCDNSYDITIQLKKPDDCSGGTKPVICQYQLKNCKLNSQSYASNIGNNKTVTLEFAAQVGGPNQANVGLFMSGLAS
jgi:hypothetical protein